MRCSTARRRNRICTRSSANAVRRKAFRMNPPSSFNRKKLWKIPKPSSPKLDWSGLADTSSLLIKALQSSAFDRRGVILLWMVASFLFSASLWYHLFGKKLVYAFPDKAPAQYLIGINQNVKSWSERQGRLDTPMEESKIDEMGNVLLVKKKSIGKKSDDDFGQHERMDSNFK